MTDEIGLNYWYCSSCSIQDGDLIEMDISDAIRIIQLAHTVIAGIDEDRPDVSEKSAQEILDIMKGK